MGQADKRTGDKSEWNATLAERFDAWHKSEIPRLSRDQNK